MSADYLPIACSVHDRLEAWAIRRTSVEVAWTEGADAHRQQAVITDVLAREGADWIVLSTGETVRADWLTAVDGFRVGPGC